MYLLLASVPRKIDPPAQVVPGEGEPRHGSLIVVQLVAVVAVPTFPRASVALTKTEYWVLVLKLKELTAFPVL